PFIFLTGSLDESAADQALKSGATDYVPKHRLAELASAVRHSLRLSEERARHAAELKDADEKIRQLNSAWEQRFGQQTAQLEAASKELEVLSYSVSHDLRAPLRHIDGFLELLKQSAGAKLEGEAREYLGIVAQSAGQLSKLLDAMLAYSRTGRVAMHPTRINMAVLIRLIRQE